MDDYWLVLNAGSSSLKFCVFQRPAREAWRLDARGQIEGIGTSPSAVCESAEEPHTRQAGSGRRDGREAIDALAVWLRSKYGGSRRGGRRSSRRSRRGTFYRADNRERKVLEEFAN